MTKEQTVPKWFEVEVYDKGEVVMNRWSGAEYELNALELSIYDMIMGAQTVIDMKYNGDMLDPKQHTFNVKCVKVLTGLEKTSPKHT